MSGEVMKFINSMVMLLFSLGLMGCSQGPKFSLDPESRDFYETSRLIMTKMERDIFNHLPDKESRQEFIQEFWSKRDPDPSTEENEFKEEFNRRIEYANTHFIEGIPGWKTDRGRIYIYLGPPDVAREFPMRNSPTIKGLLYWGYYSLRFGVEFADRLGDGSYKINEYQGNVGGLNWAIEQAQFGQIFNQDAAGKKFTDFKLRYDKASQEIEVTIPIDFFLFEEEGKLLKTNMTFEFFVYSKNRQKKDRFQQVKAFEMAEEELLQLEDVTFRFPYVLDSGKYYLDVIIRTDPDVGRMRKIFDINV
jgi:GWxTD domain-containing protein